MKRRDFLKSTFLFAAVSTVVGKAAGIFSEAQAANIDVAVGKLGYKLESPQAANKKFCDTCKWFQGTGADAGKCTLPAMKSAMKATAADSVMVKAKAYCNMWAKKA